MELIEIKKLLYKTSTKAFLKYIRKGSAYYEATVGENVKIYYQVPVSDMGDADFFPEMEGKHLIRWITEFNQDLC